MKGNIRQRGKRYRIQLFLGITPDGKRRFHTETLPTEAAAVARLHELNQEQALQDKAILTVERLLRQWIAEHVRVECQLRTLEGYEQWSQKIIARVGDQPAVSLTPVKLLKLYSALRHSGGAAGQALSRTSVRHIHRVLSAAYAHAIALGRLEINPCQQLPRTKRPKGTTQRARALTQDQLQHHVEGFKGSALYPLVALAAATGLRRGELCGLKWQDIDFEQHTLTVCRTVEKCRGQEPRLKGTKTQDSERVIRLAPSTLTILRDQKAKVAELALGFGQAPNETAVFPNKDLAHRSPAGLSKEVHRWQAVHGLDDVGLHILRHTHATHLLAARLSPKAVAERLGHSDVATTLRVYAHVLKEQEDDVVDVIEAALRS